MERKFVFFGWKKNPENLLEILRKEGKSFFSVIFLKKSLLYCSSPLVNGKNHYDDDNETTTRRIWNEKILFRVFLRIKPIINGWTKKKSKITFFWPIFFTISFLLLLLFEGIIRSKIQGFPFFIFFDYKESYIRLISHFSYPQKKK